MSDLRKCPFCGGEAEFHRSLSVIGDIVTVRCKACKAKTAGILFDARKHPNDEEYDEAAALWNTRKPVEDVLERLEKELNSADAEKKRCAGENPFHFDIAKGYATGVYNAIEIIKEELGGMTDV